MHLEQFFVHPDDVQEDIFIVRGEEARHILKSKRKRVGHTIRAVDGKGNGYIGVIQEIHKEELIVERTAMDWRQNEPSIEFILACGMIKGERLDWVIEKSTEIGLARFIPITTEYAVVSGIRMKRWRSIAIAAMKQSGRSMLPEISEPVPFQSLFDISADLKIVAHPFHPVKSLRDRMPGVPIKKVLLTVGPEGGFSDHEFGCALGAGFTVLSLGKRRLRSETAAIVAASIIMEYLGEFENHPGH